MKALTYHGSHDVRVDTARDPASADADIIVRIAATAICAWDPHIYRGKLPARKRGDILRQGGPGAGLPR